MYIWVGWGRVYIYLDWELYFVGEPAPTDFGLYIFGLGGGGFICIWVCSSILLVNPPLETNDFFLDFFQFCGWLVTLNSKIPNK